MKDKPCEISTCKGKMIYKDTKYLHTWKCDTCKADLSLPKTEEEIKNFKK